MTSAAKGKSNKKSSGKSTGPRSARGKAKSSANALSHGILSRHLLLPDEDPGEWGALLEQLMLELGPSGTLEQILVERIALAIWRQRRLVKVETARIRTAQRPGSLDRRHAEQLVGEDNPAIVEEVLSLRHEDLRRVLHQEYKAAHAAGVTDQDVLQAGYPAVWQRLLNSSKALGSVSDYLAKHYQGRLDAYLATMERMEGNILAAYARFSEDRAALSLPNGTELITRYQSALDNDLYKAMRALRDAQRFRRESLEATAEEVPPEDAGKA
jgi:hypothetical protein